MEQKTLKYIRKYVHLTEEEADAILKVLVHKTFRKGTHLLREGQISKACYFNIEGLVRQYELIDGEEKTTDFYLEGDAIVAFDSASKNIPCAFNWVCQEETTLVIGRLDKIEDNYAANPKLEKMSSLFISQNFGKYQNFSSSFVTLSPEERYLKLMKDNPALLNRVPQYHIASYLGIKPETLSRIRKRIAEHPD